MKYHFIGIKGSGMSSLSMLLKDKGELVQGSDVDDYIFTEEELKKREIPVLNFDENNFSSEDIIVIGHKFINSENKEVIKAKKENKYYEYNDFLKEFIENYYSIAISGSHGKTTITSLVANMLSEIDECGYLIGDGTSHVSPLSNYFVFEACEHKEHFLKYKSDIILINNIDYDHVDYYKSEKAYVNAFYKFVKQAKDKVILNGDDLYLDKIKNPFKYGISESNDVYAQNIVEDKRGISYDLYYHHKFIKRLEFPFYGHHMVYNTLASIAVGLYLNLNIEIIEKGIKKFKGVKRRFNETIIDDCVYIDDYAHHPSEIRATLNAVKQKYKDKRIIAFFKGDRYSRVYTFAREIASALESADEAFVLPFPSCSVKEEGIEIDETYISLFSERIKSLTELEYKKLSNYNNCVYVFMSSKNMKEIENKIIELKIQLGKQ